MAHTGDSKEIRLAQAILDHFVSTKEAFFIPRWVPFVKICRYRTTKKMQSPHRLQCNAQGLFPLPVKSPAQTPRRPKITAMEGINRRSRDTPTMHVPRTTELAPPYRLLNHPARGPMNIPIP